MNLATQVGLIMFAVGVFMAVLGIGLTGSAIVSGAFWQLPLMLVWFGIAGFLVVVSIIVLAIKFFQWVLHN